jgi:hypothetical protein
MTLQIFDNPLRADLGITPRTMVLLERFRGIMNSKDIKLEEHDETIYYSLHLALTFIHIKDIKTELQEVMRVNKIQPEIGDCQLRK